MKRTLLLGAFLCAFQAGSLAAQEGQWCFFYGRASSYYSGFIRPDYPASTIEAQFGRYLESRYNDQLNYTQFSCTKGDRRYYDLTVQDQERFRARGQRYILMTGWTPESAAASGVAPPPSTPRPSTPAPPPRPTAPAGPSAERQRANVNPAAQQEFERRRRALLSALSAYCARPDVHCATEQ